MGNTHTYGNKKRIRISDRIRIQLQTEIMNQLHQGRYSSGTDFQPFRASLLLYQSVLLNKA